MNPIKLTEEHKSKLLEMCKVLFPTWKAHSLISNEQYISDDTENFSESDETFSIHWFEFCVRQLIPKLFSDDDYGIFEDISDMNYAYVLINTSEQHPIDYLYLKFKSKYETSLNVR